MKAAVLYKDNDIRFEDVAVPVPGAHEVLVQVKKSGLCGSDIPRVLHGGAHSYPIILGHEFSGIITATGDFVTTRKEGDRIACAPLIPNMSAPESIMGNYALGKGYSFVGSRRPGGWAEYVAIPANNAVLLPDSISYTQGAFFEPLTVSLHALNSMNFKGGSKVAITGMGTIGLLALQAVKALGAIQTTVFDIDDSRLLTAAEYGADLCLNTKDTDFLTKAIAFSGGSGFDVCLETGGVPFTEILCLQAAAPKGFVMFIGTPHVPVILQPEIFELINRKELLVSGSWMNYSAPFPGREWELAAHLFSRGLIQIDKLIDRDIPLAAAADAVNDLAIPGKVQGKILFSC
ncbi:MAG: galactitol-1-phosphate 5-dehydrogenase [Spirochaetes bacterium]|nr:galactitol-1-phosphate 5-dehydrogenase [Spirochaetota bacterium]MBL7006409.1 galactitol-1-phosphate 5-dehydrogenase [Spirochaetia bacterium]